MILDEEVGWWLLHPKNNVGDVHFMKVTNPKIFMQIYVVVSFEGLCYSVEDDVHNAL
jgi:hypothetical protein